MAIQTSYILSLDRQKQMHLDGLIEKFQAYPVGTGYIDIIILRDQYVDFINELTELNLAVNSISWWCHATEENKTKYGCPHGYGGPETQFGWFSEMSHDFDDIEEIEHEHFFILDKSFDSDVIKEVNDKSISIIQNKKTITHADGNFLVFQNNPCLTPGIWVYVPDEWTRQN